MTETIGWIALVGWIVSVVMLGIVHFHHKSDHHANG